MGHRGHDAARKSGLSTETKYQDSAILAMRAFLVVLLFLPVAWAAEVEDAEGDVQLSSNGVPIAATDQWPEADLVRAWIDGETEETIDFGIEVLDNAQEKGFAQSWFHFQRADVPHWIVILLAPSGQTPSADLYRADPNAECGCASLARDLPTTVEGSQIRVKVPKALLEDASGIPLRIGESISQAYVITDVVIGSRGGNTDIGSRATDRAPDTGFIGEFISMLGAQGGSGDLDIDVQVPIRVSNGEATTIVFPLNVTNRATEPARAVVTTINVDPAWSVRVPALVELAPNSETAIPVILSIPFDHRHGETQLFDVRIEDIEDDMNFGRTTLGVHWLSIAQPAGHHDSLYLHTAARENLGFVYQEQWMNTLPPGEDPAADDLDISQGARTGRIQGAPPYDYPYSFSLRPELLLGLDFSEGLGNVAATFSPSLDAQAHLEAELALECPQPARSDCTREVLFRGESDPVSWSSRHTFEAQMERVTKHEMIPFDQLRNLRLTLVLITDQPQETAAAEARPFTLHVQDSVLQIPLDEYHDPVDQAFEDIGSLRIRAVSDFERSVNPGRGTRFDFTVGNHGDSVAVAASVIGVAPEWASWEPTRFRLGEGENRTLSVRVAPPEEAPPGTQHDFVLLVEEEGRPQSAAVAKFRVHVVDSADQEIPDEMLEPTKQGRQSPAPAAVLLVATLWLAWRRR